MANCLQFNNKFFIDIQNIEVIVKRNAIAFLLYILLSCSYILSLGDHIAIYGWQNKLLAAQVNRMVRIQVNLFLAKTPTSTNR